MTEQWYVVTDANGDPQSYGTTVADTLPKGWTAEPVDGPPQPEEPEKGDPADALDDDPDFEAMSAAQKAQTRAIVRALSR
jgi:hypothetical protein